ncbi:hypothetical protein [Rhodococcus sp. UNC23MFCrub1.1]|uniref:hypothetical protein n=1 Tax=Rhodococcus sp. UNC23MFCrub1.1 TaxID=1449068 RepID=UPI0012DD2881|nr:hypothetical protein [Rhodococcus sp. UNC23MFCrub1.1]
MKDDPVAHFAQALCELRAEHGDPPASTLNRRARERTNGRNSLPSSSLSDWFRGKSVPSSVEKFKLLVAAITQSGDIPASLVHLYRQANNEKSARTKVREPAPEISDAIEETPQPSRVPALYMLHYANIPRLSQLLFSHGIALTLPPIPHPAEREMLSFLQVMQEITVHMAQIELPTRRFTQDLNLRTLKPGDLLVFNRRVHTLNGPAPHENRPLTNDLTKDPVIYIKKSGVRIVMPYDPRYVTTDTAYSEFSAGATQMVGLCVIKRRANKEDPPHGPKLPRVQYVATPLLLGISISDENNLDLTEKIAYEAHFRDGSSAWFGPWNDKSEEDK